MVITRFGLWGHSVITFNRGVHTVKVRTVGIFHISSLPCEAPSDSNSTVLDNTGLFVRS